MIKRAVLVGISLIILAGVLAQPDVCYIGSKSNPDAHLFSYDQKFKESLYLKNYEVGMSASKEFDEATRLASNTYLKSNPHWVEIVINSDFIGIGRIGYMVLDPETMEIKEENARVSHLFVGNFTMDEHILVVKDHMNESGYLGACV